MDGRGLFEVLIVSFPKGPGCFLYVLLIAGYVVALKTGQDHESIFIRVNNPTLNQNIGKYNLSHIWDKSPFWYSRA